MKFVTSRPGSMLAAALWLAACGAPASVCDTDPGAASCTATLSQQGRSYQGRSYQGRSYQGRSYQGRSLQDLSTAASAVVQIRIGDTAVESLHLEGTALAGTVHGQVVRWTDFLGATAVQQEQDGSQFESTITQLDPDPNDPSGETLMYSLTVTDPDTGVVTPFCQTDPSGVAKAIPVAGTWSPGGAHTASSTVFTFGCTQGVLSKCLRWGYKPWKTVAGRSLAEYHQTCTRMARADYCGDGVSHTEDGTLIDLYDDLGIQQRTPGDLAALMLFDAAWTPDGAYCVAKERWLKLSSLVSIDPACKQRFGLALLTTSPIDNTDLCLVIRIGAARSSVHFDNQAGINISLF